MPLFSRTTDAGPVSLHYDLDGLTDGIPVLLIAPGGMRSANAIWDNMAWNPREALADSHPIIGMDQRNAGASTGPVSAEDGWDTYTDDQLALLDHLEVERCHVVGMCIGGPYIAALLRAAPERFVSAVMLQPVGIDDNRHALEDMFDAWANDIAHLHPHMTPDDWSSFRTNMWGGDFLLTASVTDMAAVTTPLLVLMGDDLYHPQSTSVELAATAPGATLVQRWKEGDDLVAAHHTISEFLAGAGAGTD